MRFSRKSGFNWLQTSGSMLIGGCVFLILSLLALETAAQKKKAVRKSNPPGAQASSVSPQKTLALGMYYYNSDDITGKAEQQFKMLTDRNDNSEEAESAQYFLASYYQRKFYIQRTKWRKDDWNALGAAEHEYQRYAEKYASNGQAKWLADSLFNLSLIHLQKGEVPAALQDLSRMDGVSTRDPTVYIYELV